MIGASAPLVTASCVLTGMLGANFGKVILNGMGCKSPCARGVSTGGAAFSLGAAALAKVSFVYTTNDLKNRFLCVKLDGTLCNMTRACPLQIPLNRPFPKLMVPFSQDDPDAFPFGALAMALMSTWATLLYTLPIVR